MTIQRRPILVLGLGLFCLLSALPLPPIVRDASAVVALLAAALLAWEVAPAVTLLLVYMPFRVLVEAMTPGPIVLLPDVVVLSVVARLVFRHRDQVLPLDRIEWLSLAFAGFGLIATVHAHARLSGAVLELRDLFLFVVLYAAVRRLTRVGDGLPATYWRRALPLALAAIAVVGLQGIVQTFVLGHAFLLPGKLLVQARRVSGVNSGRPYGWLDNPNTFGELGVIGLCLLYARMRDSGWRWLWWQVAMAALLAAMVVVSSSRTAYLVSLVLGVVAIVVQRRRLERLGVAAVLCAMALAVLAMPGARARAIGSGRVAVSAVRIVRSQARGRAPARPRPRVALKTRPRPRPKAQFAVFSSQYFAQSAKAGRLHNLKVALHLARRYPLGTGLGTFGSSGSKVFGTTIRGLPRNFYADNNYIVVLAETGVGGALLFLALGLSVFWTLRRSRQAPAADRALVALLFVALALMSVTGDAWEQFNLAMYPWLALAILVPNEAASDARNDGPTLNRDASLA